MAACIEAITGLAELLLKLLGPVQLKVAPVCPLADRFSAVPWHTGVLDEAEGAAGIGGSIKDIGPTMLEGQPAWLTLILE